MVEVMGCVVEVIGHVVMWVDFNRWNFGGQWGNRGLIWGGLGSCERERDKEQEREAVEDWKE